MRITRCLWLFSFFLVPFQIRAQQTTPTSPQGVTVLQQALDALAGSTAISDVTLNGSANRVAGSDNETGSIVLKALSGGQSLTNFTYAAGRRSELRSISSDGTPVGSWSGPEATTHSMPLHNLQTDSSWFFPALTLSKLLTSQSTTVALVGQETRNVVTVNHLTVTQQAPNSLVDPTGVMQHMSQMDVFLDATTLLPVALGFNIHPDDNALLDIPVEVRFSNYRTVTGVQVPFRIQQYVNNTLMLDIQLQTAMLNSGLSASAFAIQYESYHEIYTSWRLTP